MKTLKIISALILLTGGVSLVRSTVSQGTDFYVFWNAARLTLQGEPLYSIARDAGMVFKYPPWLLPFFLPFGLLSVENAKWIWGMIEVLSLASIVRWLQVRLRIKPAIWFTALLIYWGLWIVHALDGQFSLMMLALALWAWSPQANYGVKFYGLAIALSSKIFTVFPLAGLRWSKRMLGALIALGLVVSGLSLPAIYTQPGHNPISLIKDWKEAATSAGKLLSPIQVRGRSNPGLPGYTLQLLRVPAENSKADVLAALIFSLILGVAWWKLSRSLKSELQWIGWLALTPVVHPLPWWHLFVFTFPLGAYVLNRSYLDRSIQAKALGVLGLILITISTEKVWGKFGIFLELNAAKSWGTLLCLSALLHFEKSRGPVPSSLPSLSKSV